MTDRLKKETVVGQNLLNKTYDEIMQRNVGDKSEMPHRNQHAIKLYSLVLTAFVPFTVDMLTEAVAKNFETGEKDPAVTQDYIRDLVRDVFVEAPGKVFKGTIFTFAHISVKEYLEQAETYAPYRIHQEMIQVLILNLRPEPLAKFGYSCIDFGWSTQGFLTYYTLTMWVPHWKTWKQICLIEDYDEQHHSISRLFNLERWLDAALAILLALTQYDNSLAEWDFGEQIRSETHNGEGLRETLRLKIRGGSTTLYITFDMLVGMITDNKLDYIFVQSYESPPELMNRRNVTGSGDAISNSASVGLLGQACAAAFLALQLVFEIYGAQLTVRKKEQKLGEFHEDIEAEKDLIELHEPLVMTLEKSVPWENLALLLFGSEAELFPSRASKPLYLLQRQSSSYWCNFFAYEPHEKISFHGWYE